MINVIEQAKAALGELATMTADEIAEKLAAEGWLRCESGRIVRSISCPIWRYLAERADVQGHRVAFSGTLLPLEGKIINHPDSVSDFIRNFDSGLYDHLRNDKEDV